METWEERKAEDGRLFYLNTKSNETSWIRPEDNKDPKTNPTEWEESITQSGKIYYINQRTSETSWEIPAEVQEWKNKVSALNLQEKLIQENSDAEECEEGQIPDEFLDKDGNPTRKEEIKQAYVQMFQEAGVTSTWKWEDFHRIMRDDPRFNMMKNIAPKKQIFQEYAQMLKRKDREDAKKKKQVARENFMKMLDSSGILRAESKYYKTAHFFQGDPRWRILEEKEREELFQDFLDELERRDREKQRQLRKQQMQSLRKLLDDREDIDHTMKWGIIQRLLAEHPLFKAIDKLDQLTVFSEYVLDTEKQVSEAKRLEERTKARKRREAFRELLEDLVKTGEINAASHWRPIVQKIKDDPRYLNLVGQPGSSPQELYSDIIEREKEKIKDHKEALSDSLLNFQITPTTTYEDILEHSREALDSIPDNLRVIVFRVLYDEAMIDLKDKERKTQKELNKYDDYLKSNANIASNSTYTEFENEIKEKFVNLSDTQLRDIFNKFVEKLKDEEASEIEPGEIKNKKRDRKEKDHKKHKHDEKHKHKHRSSRSPSHKKHKHKHKYQD
ncbi:unnamed protein product [Blepharisma stoltei]|uniref:Uncharacterized protein n=1 Tax=Blepharisma stoltei TaxID=1481888 RepID=A0AAU9JEI0_9CILI|nr:unnamed protein product [Blepharisma stoltei]